MKKINLVLLHGWLFDSFIWRDLKTDLENSFCVKSPNLTKHMRNREKMISSELNIENYLKDESWKNILIGYSFGGMMCVRFALENTRISKLILINSCFPSSYNEINDKEINSLIANLTENKDDTIKKFIYKCCKDSVTHKRDFKRLLGLKRKYLNIDSEDLIQSLENIKELRASLNKKNSLKIDTLIIQGEHDSFFPPRSNKENKYSNIEHRIVKGMAHYPFLSFHNEIKTEIIRFIEG